MALLNSTIWTHAEIISACGTAIALVGAGATAIFALINVRNAVKWKRAELANSYLKELVSDDTIAFATRSLDWLVGTFAVPARLLPLVPDGATAMQHDDALMRNVALNPTLIVSQMQADFRVEIYRTAIDSFLTWLSIIENALARDLFLAEDMIELSYWINKVATDEKLMKFARAFNYDRAIVSLCRHFNVPAPA
jgi:hypothetical protein